MQSHLGKASFFIPLRACTITIQILTRENTERARGSERPQGHTESDPAELLRVGIRMWGLVQEGRFERLPGLSLTGGNLN